MRLPRGFEEKIGAQEYPATTEEVIEEHGDLEFEHPNEIDGAETLRDVLARLDSETYETAEDLRLSAYSAVSSDAIGRKGYSDRDSPSIGEDGHDQLSF